MGVPGEGEGDRRMPCDRRNICRRNPVAEHVRYGSVPEVVEPHSLQARPLQHRVEKLSGHVPRLQGPPEVVREDKIPGPARATLQYRPLPC